MNVVLILIRVIQILADILVLIILASVVLSYFMPPYHTIRQTLDRLVEPLLRPIRRLLPPTGPLDLSPLVLLILVQVGQWLFISVLRSLL